MILASFKGTSVRWRHLSGSQFGRLVARPVRLVELAPEDGQQAADAVVEPHVHDELQDLDDLQLRVHHQRVLLLRLQRRRLSCNR